MNTPTHILVAATLLARPQSWRRNLTVFVGALVPDLSIFIFFAWMQLFTSFSMEQIWRDAYWTEPWQTIGAISNSVPIAIGLLILGIWRKASLLSVFSIALLSHALLDFPLHADDAHRHFWPLSDWRFQSPVSYWDPAHYGALGGLIELAVFFLAAAILWQRFRERWVRVAVAATAVLYIAVALFFLIEFPEGSSEQSDGVAIGGFSDNYGHSCASVEQSPALRPTANCHRFSPSSLWVRPIVA